MAFTKKFDNGFRLVVNKIEGLFTVSIGVLVKTGSINEEEENNGISHFIEHTVFKGTKTRSSFDISNEIDKIGGQINAFTSKEITCYYTKSISSHAEESIEILSDIFFNSVFDKEELEKEKGVIIEEINMSEDTPEDLCLDLLAESCYGKDGLGRTILGGIKNVSGFTKCDIESYMDKYYTADNVVLSIAGNIEEEKAIAFAEKYFANNFKRIKSAPQKTFNNFIYGNVNKVKKIEQAHVAFSLPAFSVKDERVEALSIGNMVFGGGMSSRLFQKIREELGLCYSIYSYPSQYKDSGVIEIYVGVNTGSRDAATEKILDEIARFKNGITEEEFVRGKEQVKSAFIMGQESTSSQMLLYGKYLLFFDKLFDFDGRIKKIDGVKIEEVNSVIKEIFSKNVAVATVGRSKKKLKI